MDHPVLDALIVTTWMIHPHHNAIGQQREHFDERLREQCSMINNPA